MIIDVHCHFLPQEYLEILEREGPRFGVSTLRDATGAKRIEMKGERLPPLDPFVRLEARLSDMQKMGIDRSILTLPAEPGADWADATLAEAICRASNNGFSRLIGDQGGKISALAALPMPDPVRAACELERAVGKLGLKGGSLGTNVNGRYIEDYRFYPVYEAATALKVPLMIHPAHPAGKQQMKDYRLYEILGAPTECANTIARLIYSDVPDQFPDLQFIFLLGGGAAPSLVGRLTRGARAYTDCRKGERGPLEYMCTNLFFDTVVFHPAALRFLAELGGSERILFGTDLPNEMSDCRMLETLEAAGLDTEARANIMHRNAQKLFGL